MKVQTFSVPEADINPGLADLAADRVQCFDPTRIAKHERTLFVGAARWTA